MKSGTVRDVNLYDVHELSPSVHRCQHLGAETGQRTPCYLIARRSIAARFRASICFPLTSPDSRCGQNHLIDELRQAVQIAEVR